jgi:hypothetical protein
MLESEGEMKKNSLLEHSHYFCADSEFDKNREPRAESVGIKIDKRKVSSTEQFFMLDIDRKD